MPEAPIENYTPYAPSSSTLEWPQALSSAGIAVLATIVLIVITPFGLGTLPAGFLCVVFYRRRRPAIHLTVGMGARLGALTGGVSFAFVAAILALWTAFRSGKEIHDAVISRIQQYAAQSSYPQMQQVMDLLNTPEGFTFFMIFSLILAFIAFTIFSTLGGAVGAFLLNRKERL